MRDLARRTISPVIASRTISTFEQKSQDVIESFDDRAVVTLREEGSFSLSILTLE
jgi:hypothetical protein